MTEQEHLSYLVEEYWAFDKAYSHDIANNLILHIEDQTLREQVITMPLMFNCYPYCNNYEDLARRLIEDEDLYESEEDADAFARVLDELEGEALERCLREWGWRVACGVAVGISI